MGIKWKLDIEMMLVQREHEDDLYSWFSIWLSDLCRVIKARSIASSPEAIR